MRNNRVDRFTLIKRALLIFLCASILVLGIVILRFFKTEDIPEGIHYVQTTADNGVVLHVLQTEPSHISLKAINDNVVRSGSYGINGGYFWEDRLLSIAVMDGEPTNGRANEYGSGWFNVKYDRGTMVYDRITKKVNVQQVSSADELRITDETKYWAQGGVSMNITNDDKWVDVAINGEGLPFPDDKRLRSAMAYDSAGDIYLIVSSSKCTAEQFRSAIKSNVGVGKLQEGIFLDGDGSSQLLAGNVKLKGDSRTVVQMIVVNGEGR
ncbi:phosphodiester glycosidase family protein [Paenibacillus sp. Marseille-Q7038]